MVMRPRKPYLLVQCQKCTWHAFFYQKSDCLVYPHVCPVCGDQDPQLRFMSFWEKVRFLSGWPGWR